MTKSTLPVGGYSVNPYVGCTHAVSYTHLSAETSIKRCSDRSHITVGTKARRIAAQSSGLVAVQSAYSVRHMIERPAL